jgi:hypothetical protein
VYIRAIDRYPRMSPLRIKFPATTGVEAAVTSSAKPLCGSHAGQAGSSDTATG